MPGSLVSKALSLEVRMGWKEAQVTTVAGGVTAPV